VPRSGTVSGPAARFRRHIRCCGTSHRTCAPIARASHRRAH